MTERDSGVTRGDHNLEGAREIANDPNASQEGTASDSADMKAHGTHGRGRGTERRQDQPEPTPDNARGSDQGSSSWGSEGSGGSVTDKRSPND
jgi:hypothetical protein